MCLDRDRCECGEIVGPFERVSETPQAVHATLCVQLLRGIHTGSEQHVPRNRPTEFVAHAFDRPLIDGESQLRSRNTESAGRTRHAQIASDRKLRAGTHCRPVDRRERDARQGREAAQRRTKGVGEFVTFDAREIGPRTESGWLARQHHDSCHSVDGTLVRNQSAQSLEIDGIAPVRPSNRDDGYVRALPFKGDRTVAVSTGTILPIRAYHQPDCMTSGNPSPSLSDDPVRIRRAQVAKYTLLANRVGYLLYAATIACFVFAFALGFNSTMVGIMTFGLVAGSILLAPSIVLGYAVKAAEREDREREQAAGK